MHILSSLLLITILAASPSPVSSSGVVHQQLTSSARMDLMVNVLVETTINATMSYQPSGSFEFSLLPNISQPTIFPLQTFRRAFHYEMIMLNPITGRVEARVRRSFMVEQRVEWNSVTFFVNGTMLTIETRYECTKNFYGPQCEQHCNLNPIQDERKRCDRNGQVRCNYGWMGAQCNQVVDPRKCGCQNEGVCASSLLLQSSYNPLIATSSSSSSLAAQSEESLICECPAGFSGEKCELAMMPGIVAEKSKACDSTTACLNGGQCFANGPHRFCACPAGFLGHFCEFRTTTDIPMTTSPAAAFNISTITLTIIALIIVFLAACFKYKIQPKREQALARRQLPPPFAQPIQKSILVANSASYNKMRGSKIYTIENGNGIDSKRFVGNEHIYHSYDSYERYTTAPNFCALNVDNDNVNSVVDNNNLIYGYATIEKSTIPPPPSHLPPPTPLLP